MALSPRDKAILDYDAKLKQIEADPIYPRLNDVQRRQFRETAFNQILAPALDDPDEAATAYLRTVPTFQGKPLTLPEPKDWIVKPTELLEQVASVIIDRRFAEASEKERWRILQNISHLAKTAPRKGKIARLWDIAEEGMGWVVGKTEQTARGVLQPFARAAQAYQTEATRLLHKVPALREADVALTEAAKEAGKKAVEVVGGAVEDVATEPFPSAVARGVVGFTEAPLAVVGGAMRELGIEGRRRPPIAEAAFMELDQLKPAKKGLMRKAWDIVSAPPPIRQAFIGEAIARTFLGAGKGFKAAVEDPLGEGMEMLPGSVLFPDEPGKALAADITFGVAGGFVARPAVATVKAAKDVPWFVRHEAEIVRRAAAGAVPSELADAAQKMTVRSLEKVEGEAVKQAIGMPKGEAAALERAASDRALALDRANLIKNYRKEYEKNVVPVENAVGGDTLTTKDGAIYDVVEVLGAEKRIAARRMDYTVSVSFEEVKDVSRLPKHAILQETRDELKKLGWDDAQIEALRNPSLPANEAAYIVDLGRRGHPIDPKTYIEEKAFAELRAALEKAEVPATPIAATEGALPHAPAAPPSMLPPLAQTDPVAYLLIGGGNEMNRFAVEAALTQLGTKDVDGLIAALIKSGAIRQEGARLIGNVPLSRKAKHGVWDLAARLYPKRTLTRLRDIFLEQKDPGRAAVSRLAEHYEATGRVNRLNIAEAVTAARAVEREAFQRGLTGEAPLFADKKIMNDAVVAVAGRDEIVREVGMMTPTAAKRTAWMTPEQIAWAEDVVKGERLFYSQFGDALKEADVNVVEDYYRRVYANLDAVPGWRLAQFYKERRLATIQEAERMGLQMIGSPSERMTQYGEFADSMLRRRQLIEMLLEARTLFPRMQGATPPGGWVPIGRKEVPRFYDALSHYGKNTDDSFKQAWRTMLKEGDIYAPQDVKDLIKTVFRPFNPVEAGQDQSILRVVRETLGGAERLRGFGDAYDAVNVIFKSMMLRYSMFHGMAIGWNATQLGMSPLDFMRGLRMLADDPSLLEDGIMHGLAIGESADAMKSLFYRVAGERATEGLSVGVRHVFRLPLGITKAQDHLLWDTFHRGTKIAAYTDMTNILIRKYPDMPVDEIKRQAARFINDAAGSQMVTRMFISEQGMRQAQRILLSPDWQLSSKRTWLLGLEAWAKQTGGLLKGNIALTDSLTPNQYLAFLYTARSLMFQVGLLNAFNLAMTAAEDGEARNMWDNPGGRNKGKVFIRRDFEERGMYIQVDKGIIDLWELIRDLGKPERGTAAFEAVWRISAPLPQAVATQFGINPFDSPTTAMERVGALIPMPISYTSMRDMSGRPVPKMALIAGGLGMPISRYTAYQFQKDLASYYEFQAWNDATRTMFALFNPESEGVLAQIASENGLDFEALKNRTMNELWYEKVAGFKASDAFERLVKKADGRSEHGALALGYLLVEDNLDAARRELKAGGMEGAEIESVIEAAHEFLRQRAPVFDQNFLAGKIESAVQRPFKAMAVRIRAEEIGAAVEEQEKERQRIEEARKPKRVSRFQVMPREAQEQRIARFEAAGKSLKAKKARKRLDFYENIA